MESLCGCGYVGGTTTAEGTWQIACWVHTPHGDPRPPVYSPPPIGQHLVENIWTGVGRIFLQWNWWLIRSVNAAQLVQPPH